MGLKILIIEALLINKIFKKKEKKKQMEDMASNYILKSRQWNKLNTSDYFHNSFYMLNIIISFIYYQDSNFVEYYKIVLRKIGCFDVNNVSIDENEFNNGDNKTIYNFNC